MRKPPFAGEAFQPQNYGASPSAQENTANEAQKICDVSSTRTERASARLSVYAGVSPECAGSATLSETAHRIREDDSLRKATEKLRGLSGEAQRRAKNALPSTTFAGIFDYRANDKLSSYSALVVLDFDHLSAHGRKAAELRGEIGKHPSCALAFVSPKADGVKAVFALDAADLNLSDMDAVQAFHGRAYEAVRADCEDKYGVPLDVSGKDLSRLCFLCHDAEAAYNSEPAPFAVPPEPENAAQNGRTGEFPTTGGRTAPGRALPPVPFASPANRTRAVADVGALCRWAAETGTDITAGYDDWYRIALALARAARRGELPEEFAGDAFHALSANHPAYSPAQCGRKFADALRDAGDRPNGVTLGTVFYVAKNCGYVRQSQKAADGADDDRVVRVERYASEALDKIESELAPGAVVLLQAPTNAGKTKAVFALARRLADAGTFRRVWVVGPFTRLARQNENEYKVPGVYGGVAGVDVQAARAADALVTTFDGLEKLGGVPPGTLLVVDESHELADAQGYRKKALKLVTQGAETTLLSGGALLYVTATPGEGFADMIGASVLKIAPDRVSKKTVCVRTGAAAENFDRCLFALARRLRDDPGGLFALFCNSKGRLDDAERFLRETGLPADAVARVTADDDGDAVRALLAGNRFPAGVRVVLATKALGAGYNVLNENVRAVFYCANGNEGLRPGDAAQYTARFRTAGNLEVFAYVCEPKPDHADAGRTTTDLKRAELRQAEKAIEARRGVDLAPVDDCLPALRLGGDDRAVKRTTDPDSGHVQQTDKYAAYFHASERRARARSLEDFKREWQSFDPGVSFAERDEPEPDAETRALLQRVRDERKDAQKQARETVSGWDALRGLTAAYHAVPRLKNALRRCDPRVRDSERPADGDMAAFRTADGPKAAKRFLRHQSDGYDAQTLWRLCVSEADPNKWQAFLNGAALGLHLEREAGNVGARDFVDRYKAFAFDAWMRHGLTELVRLAKTNRDGVNLKEAYESVRTVLKRRGVVLTWNVFRSVLTPLHCRIGKQRRINDGDGKRVRVRTLTMRPQADVCRTLAERYGLDWDRLVRRKKEQRERAAKEAADRNESARRDNAERGAKEAQPLPVPAMAARFGADNATDAVTFANDPPDAEPCPF